MEPLSEFLALPEGTELVGIVRLLAAALLGGLVGYEREITQKSAGLRTHMLVSMGAALFVIAGVQGHMGIAEVSRVYQGLIAGIGFLGAGAIVRRSNGTSVKGLTTAASIWIACAIGAAAGSGHLWLPLSAGVLAWIVLGPLQGLEERMKPNGADGDPHEDEEA